MGKIYAKIFATIYDHVMLSAEKSLANTRHNLLNNLTGNILEIGSGTGVNFQYYKSNAQVIAIEPNISMLEKSKVKIVNKPITLINNGVNDKAMDFKEAQFDYVVCTLVLCTIPNLNLAFKKINKWLKPDGKLIVLEHIKSKNKLIGSFQQIINPVWKVIGEGCNLTRSTDKIIKNNGFKHEQEEYILNKVLWYNGIFVKNENE